MTHHQHAVVLASNNAGKLREIEQLLQPDAVRLYAQAEFGIDSVEETGLTFVENAILKARHAAAGSGLPAIADDSGLEVDALKGAPGIHSARYAGPHADDQANCAKLLEALAEVPQGHRQARFQCLLVYLRHAEDPTPVICQGTWEGRILTELRGDQGFGYDPLFWVPGQNCSAAELDSGTKNALSHRGQALAQLLAALGDRFA
ncbi:RdgB/HAM1 family non-canonical purine NTP pyrophosphatase [Thiorhodovibrio frisius]|uniref:dITP/XTP pyrophosphatase n=1 Tax=Thiorhodovibrio frisius TaxID=631362 RepID=H8Z7N2_9GAMM|nr:RdgB/HAM1 family non-canonical purine NTP pyrophosphatase [Thiorhodovibrio frisius]EIC19885.1 non-canonical purine NTP pyrophosphatase, rdgB/HAM1 family [Thiorhodovibrio frisius]WPL20613.1 dITP/XTP pyrophosphatase [Thiorhodovibrio frisius]